MIRHIEITTRTSKLLILKGSAGAWVGGLCGGHGGFGGMMRGDCWELGGGPGVLSWGVQRVPFVITNYPFFDPPQEQDPHNPRLTPPSPLPNTRKPICLAPRPLKPRPRPLTIISRPPDPKLQFLFSKSINSIGGVCAWVGGFVEAMEGFEA